MRIKLCFQRTLALAVVFCLLFSALPLGSVLPLQPAPVNATSLSLMPPHPDLLEKWRKHPEQMPPLLLQAKPMGLNQPAERALNPSGSFNALVLLVDFSDKQSQVTASYWDTLVFGTSKPSVRHYYNEVSYGTLDVVTLNLPSSTGWFRAPQTYAYYVAGNNGWGTYPNNAQKLVEDLVALADPVVDFSKYDNDHDGYVDALMIVHAGTGAEASGDVNDIWSHKWGISAKFVDGVGVSPYCMMPEYWPTSWAPLPNMTIGVYCHELGHVFGLPDLYDYDYTSCGVGRWCLMSYGSWNGVNGGSPAHPSAWCRAKLGWATPNSLTTDKLNSNIGAVESGGTIYRLWNGGITGSEYFLVENRQATGYDSALPSFGLLIWHIDESKGGNTQECTNLNNWLCSNHYKVALEQADGLLELENKLSYGNSGDPYPGSTSNRNFTFTTTPNSSSYYSSTDTLVKVENISASASTMTADLRIRVAQKLIGADDTTATGNNAGNYLFCDKWTAQASGTITAIKIKCGTSGNVKVAIYADSSGEPGDLLNAVNTSTPVTPGWNTIAFPTTSVTQGTTYWLASISDAYCIGYKYQPGYLQKYKPATYSTFTFLGSAGTSFSNYPGYNIIAGWP